MPGSTSGLRLAACLVLLVAVGGPAARAQTLPPADSLARLRADSLARVQRDSLAREALRRAALGAYGLTPTVRARWTAAAPEPVVPPPSGKSVWTRRLRFRLSGSQTASHNWTQGGVNTLAATGRIEGKAERLSRSLRQTHELALALGGLVQQRQARRKTDDEIRIESSLRHRLRSALGPLQPTASLGMRTQFTGGYAYDKNPFTGSTADVPVKISDLFSPAVLTQSVGLTMEPAKGVVQRAGVGGRQVIVLIDRFGALHGLAEGRKLRGEAGFDARTDVDRRIAENVRLKASLGLFADMLRATPVDVAFESTLELRVNRWLQTNVRLQSVFDADRSRALQLREAVDVGVTLPLL